MKYINAFLIIFIFILLSSNVFANNLSEVINGLPNIESKGNELLINPYLLAYSEEATQNNLFPSSVIGNPRFDVYNLGNDTINRTIDFSLLNPNGLLISKERFEVYLEPKENKTYYKEGSNGYIKVDSYASYLIEKPGTYTFLFELNEPLVIFRCTTFDSNNQFCGGGFMHVFDNNQKYTFEVMPQSEFKIWLETKNATQESINLNKQIKSLTNNIEDLSHG